jgi:imidazolonepropionase-like amidohydrolase
MPTLPQPTSEQLAALALIGSTGSHADIGGMYASRWHIQPTQPADGAAEVHARVRTEHKYGSDWIKTANAGGYYSTGDDPARLTWSDEEMTALVDAASQLDLPVAVHTGAAEACKQAIPAGARSLEHVYLIDNEALTMAEAAGTFIVPTAPTSGCSPSRTASRSSKPWSRPGFTRTGAVRSNQCRRGDARPRRHRRARGRPVRRPGRNAR